MSPMTPQKATRKRYSLFVLAIIFLLLAGAALFLGTHDFVIRIVGVVGCIISVYLVRISNVHIRQTAIMFHDQRADIEPKKGLGHLVWTVGIALLVLTWGAFFYLYQDALHGYHEALPVYLFAGVGLACTIVWSYLISKLLSGDRKQGSRRIT
jgi:hypothetical protein